MIGFAKKTEVKVHKIGKLGRDRNASAETFQPFGDLKLSIFTLFYTIRNRYVLTTLYLKFLLAFFPSREFLSTGRQLVCLQSQISRDGRAVTSRWPESSGKSIVSHFLSAQAQVHHSLLMSRILTAL